MTGATVANSAFLVTIADQLGERPAIASFQR